MLAKSRVILVRILLFCCFLQFARAPPPHHIPIDGTRNGGKKSAQISDVTGGHQIESPSGMKQRHDDDGKLPGEKVAGNVHRPSHLDAVPLERDGALNKQFRKEVIFGLNNNVDKAGKVVAVEKESKGHNDDSILDAQIKAMFHRADSNKDGKLSEEELREQIAENTNKHLEDAKMESADLFQVVDADGNGKIQWNEYKVHFLVESGIVSGLDEAKKNVELNHADNKLGKDARMHIQDELDSFKQADADGDGLDEEEWLGFRHPETGKAMLREMAEEILKAFDKDKDGQLTADEFAKGASNDAIQVSDPKMEEQYVKERVHEFKTSMDKDGDGLVTLTELGEYVDPRNGRHAREEALELLSIADADEDGQLSLKELLAKADQLGGFIHAKERLHEDL